MSTVSTENEATIQKTHYPLQVAKRLEKFQRDWGGATNQKDGIINLGRGFPNFDGPEFIKEAAIQAIRDGKNQYARGFGVPELNIAIADRFKKDTGIVVDPDKEVTVTNGCLEAIAATVLGLINPGDEVILFTPLYDCYEANLTMAGAKIKSISLHPPDFAVPIEKLKSIVSSNTRAILINTPHNPTGKMFTLEELNAIASLCIENDVLVFADEAHSFVTFSSPNALQCAAAVALRAPDSYYVELKRDYIAKRAILVEGLKAVGFKVFPPNGTFFVLADHTHFGMENDVAFCKYLHKEVGVVAIPCSVFCLNPEEGKKLVRFVFCKDEETLRAAVERMKEKL
ncbi:Methionine aminotransferase [Glycine soja]